MGVIITSFKSYIFITNKRHQRNGSSESSSILPGDADAVAVKRKQMQMPLKERRTCWNRWWCLFVIKI